MKAVAMALGALVGLALAGLVWCLLWNLVLIPIVAAAGGTLGTLSYWTSIGVALLWTIITAPLRGSK